MSRQVSRRQVVRLVAWAGLIVVSGLVVWSWIRSESIAADEAARLVECESFASKIAILRQRQASALLESKPSSELNRLIDGWRTQASIPAENLLKIEPRQPRRVRDTQYLDQSTELGFSDVTLGQVAEFARRAQLESSGLKLTSIRVTAPRRMTELDASTELWDVEMALTYFIYAPKSR